MFGKLIWFFAHLSAFEQICFGLKKRKYSHSCYLALNNKINYAVMVVKLKLEAVDFHFYQELENF